MTALSDSECYQAFDACYDYDIYEVFRDAIEGTVPLSAYAAAVTQQEGIYPDNYLKMRCLENHDRARAAQLIPDEKMLRNWTAFNYFQKGLTMLYNGQEVCALHTPSLFDKDTIRWNTGMNLSPLLTRLAQIKRDPLFADSCYQVKAMPRDILLATHEKNGEKLVGIFSIRGEASLLAVDIPDGCYENLITGETVEVHAGKLPTAGEPIILKA